MLRTLLEFGIRAERRTEYTGVWLDNAKIGFIGVRLAQGFTMHGFSLNVNNDPIPLRLNNALWNSRHKGHIDAGIIRRGGG